jgi:hypothetical protein
MQVYFAPDPADRDWKVVLQKESQSRKEEAEKYDSVIEAPGRTHGCLIGHVRGQRHL